METTKEVMVYLNLFGIESEGIIDVPTKVAEDGDTLFRFIMDNIEVDWDN
jgi:hypothetical protein